MNEQVDEVKSKVDIVALISEYVELKKAGRNFKAPCPFHPEKTPSFMVSPELQIYKCFGCGESGDVFSFLEKYEGMEFYEALKYLAQKVGVKLKPTKFNLGSEKDALYRVNSWATYFYHYILAKHPAGKAALNYLTRERHIRPQTIETFNLGFSPNTPLALKRFLVDKKKAAPSDLERAGLAYRRGGDVADRFRGRVVFPLFDHRGNNVGFAGRVLPGATSDVAKYINSPETEIYHKSKIFYGLNITKADIKKAGEAVIVEGELDAISSYQAGIKNVIAIKGSAVTRDQASLLARFAQKVVLALDADFAGNEAARRGLKVLEQSGLEVRVAKLTDFKDPDEAAHKNPTALKEAITKARLVWDFVVDMVFEKYKGEPLSRTSRELAGYLATIGDEIVRAHYVNLVSQRLKVPFEAVAKEVTKLIAQKDVEKTSLEVVSSTPNKKERRELLEERYLSLAFKKDPSMLTDGKLNDLFATPLATKIHALVVEYLASHKKFNLGSFAKSIPSEIVWGFSEIILKQVDGLDEETLDNIDKELALTEKAIRVLHIKGELVRLSAIIQDLEGSGQEEKLKKAQEKFAKLTKKLGKLVEGNIHGIIS